MINGGIDTLEAVDEHLRHVSGVMLGRAAYHDPQILAEVDARVFGKPAAPLDIAGVVVRMADYAERQLGQGGRLNQITRHMLGLANGLPGARHFRQILSVEACKPGAGPEVLFQALAAIEPQAVAAE